MFKTRGLFCSTLLWAKAIFSKFRKENLILPFVSFALISTWLALNNPLIILSSALQSGSRLIRMTSAAAIKSRGGHLCSNFNGSLTIFTDYVGIYTHNNL